MILSDLAGEQVVSKKIWIDLDNSPHVPFFAPIIDQLQRRGYSVLITARHAFQVCELAKAAGLDYKVIGRHFGKHKLAKIAGLAVRAAQLIPTAIKERPDLAISHGSRAQLVAAALAGIPSVLLMDYEYARGLIVGRPSWVMIPETIGGSAIHIDKDRLLKYPGIKEDVYVPNFKPDPSIRGFLGIDSTELLVTIRPPAQEAHYHKPDSDRMFATVLGRLSEQAGLRMVMLPRNSSQEIAIRRRWPKLFELGKAIVPRCAVDGLNLIWHSDLVISGGGTMNREAAALGVPVYSIFRGQIGAVDRFLATNGRLILLETVDDVAKKLILKRRSMGATPKAVCSNTLKTIVSHIATIAETHGSPVHRKASTAGVSRQP